MLDIYTNSADAARKLLPEAMIALAIVKEEELADDQSVSFHPDLNMPSFDILSSPVEAKIAVNGKISPLAFSPEEEKSIGDVILDSIAQSGIKGSSTANKSDYSFKPKN